MSAAVITDRAEQASYRDVFGLREFSVIFAANTVSMLGTVVAAVALTVLVYEQTRSPALAASVMALSFLPYLIGGTLLSAAVDRLPPARHWWRATWPARWWSRSWSCRGCRWPGCWCCCSPTA
jgi:hypothetical protein